jgi:hypothetical protein
VLDSDSSRPSSETVRLREAAVDRQRGERRDDRRNRDELHEDRADQTHRAAEQDAQQRGQPRVHPVLHEEGGRDQREPEHRAHRQVDLAHGDQERHAAGDDADVGGVLDDLLQLPPGEEVGVDDPDEEDQRDSRDQDAVGLNLERAASEIAESGRSRRGVACHQFSLLLGRRS